ncbi:hypothetical protein EV421DRAFT_1734533 [Armillaria borealis]|uniref:Uncharacterized protein n=1 Tax=Armillaria borealis TaxID=47425 RepID=A0AA39JNI7_9AGAR|nr:hypothetical protein EV421DRAFT_1734533 [Armillaria borealis]
MTIEVKPLETPEKLDFPSVSRSKGNQEGNGRHDSNTQNVFNERRVCSRPEPSYAESDDSTDTHFVSQGPKIHPHILIEAIMSYWLVHRCSKREQVVADRLPQDHFIVAHAAVYVRVGATTMMSYLHENLKRSDMINDQKNVALPYIAARSVRWTLLGKIHPFDMRLSVRIKFSMEQKEVREVSASNAPVLPLRWYLDLIQKGSNINLHKALAPQEKNVANAVVKKNHAINSPPESVEEQTGDKETRPS